MRDFTALAHCPRCYTDERYTFTFLQFVGGMVQLEGTCQKCKSVCRLWVTVEKYIFISGGEDEL